MTTKKKRTRKKKSIKKTIARSKKQTKSSIKKQPKSSTKKPEFDKAWTEYNTALNGWKESLAQWQKSTNKNSNSIS